MSESIHFTIVFSEKEFINIYGSINQWKSQNIPSFSNTAAKTILGFTQFLDLASIYMQNSEISLLLLLLFLHTENTLEVPMKLTSQTAGINPWKKNTDLHIIFKSNL